MLRNRTRLSTVSVVVLGTIVSTQPLSHAQHTSGRPASKQPSNYAPAKLSIGANTPQQNRTHQDAFILEGPAPTASESAERAFNRPASEAKTPATNNTQSTTKSSIEGDSYLAPRTSRSILLEYGEGDHDRAPFGLVSKTSKTTGEPTTSPGKPANKQAQPVNISSQPNDALPTASLPPIVRPEQSRSVPSSKSAPSAPARKSILANDTLDPSVNSDPLGPITGLIDVEQELMDHDSALLDGEPGTTDQDSQTSRDVKESELSVLESDEGIDLRGSPRRVSTGNTVSAPVFETSQNASPDNQLGNTDAAMEMSAQEAFELDVAPEELEVNDLSGMQVSSESTPAAEPNYTETINDVYVDADASDTDLLDVDPGLPAINPEDVEDVSITPDISRNDAEPLLIQDETREKNGRPIRTPRTIKELGGAVSNKRQMSSTDAAGANSEPFILQFESDEDETSDHDGQSEDSPATSRSHIELQEELHQEAPAIDLRQSQNRTIEEGVNAHLAIKPISVRRESEQIEGFSPAVELPPIVSSKQPPAISAADAQRLERTNACLAHYLNNPESTSIRSPWAVMHALIAFGAEYELQHGNSRVNAIGWMCHNGTCRTQRMFTPRGNGFVPNVGAGVQGHEGQFLAVLAQSNVPLDYPIQIGTNQYRVEDLVRYEMATCKEKSELTFKLIGLSYYLDSNKQWKANDGRVWSIPKLIQEELSQPVVGSACGGTHRLMGFSFAVRQRAMQGQPIDGQYARANQFVKAYIDYTWKLQNPDGSFSTSWYEGRGNEPNEERKVQTTGHMLEWLMYTLPDSEINQARVQRSVDFLLSKIYDKKEHSWPIGPRGHATRAIALYQARYQEILSTAPELLEQASSQNVANYHQDEGVLETPAGRPVAKSAEGQRPINQSTAARSTQARSTQTQNRTIMKSVPNPWNRSRGYRR